MPSPPLWKASVTLAKGEASDMASLIELASEPQAVLIAEEPFGPSATVEALYTEEPDAGFLSALAGRTIAVEPLPDQDWIRLSQKGLPPVRSGRFFVYGAHDAGIVPDGTPPQSIRRLFDIFHAHYEATLNYIHDPLDRDITLLRCREELPQSWLDVHCAVGSNFASDTNGWERLSPRSLTVIDVKGNHMTMMTQPHVVDVAAKLATAIEGVR